MSRVAKAPVVNPSNVTITFADNLLTVKGPKGTLEQNIHKSVDVEINDDNVTVKPINDEQQSWALAGTMRALANNMVIGVTDGFSLTLELVGVGYRAQVQGKAINLSLGFSHPVIYNLPEGVTASTPNPTTVVLESINKQLLGQTAAEIRSYRPPEPYKGKGIKYAGEVIVRKEAKKK